MSFPPLPASLTYDAVYERLALVRPHLPPCVGDDEHDDVDVRLVVDDDGSWWINTGDVCYDTRHGAWCGASTMASSTSDDDLREVAIDLVDQVEDAVASHFDDVPEVAP